ncbi:MAG: ribose 5-phosphate isomerase B [Planctomycetaceae bacterium]|jgi:ribose 5-phosphate isomerase B|nr:ribose 5-phosphate isomerase B [Planctomycetaceae bacterium]
MSLNLIIGSDHRGVSTRMKLTEYLRQKGYSVTEFGPALDAASPTDYPDVAAEIARSISRGENDRGILICGTGIGMCIAANKFPGIQAAPVIDELSAELSRRHNNLNILCLAGDMLNEEQMMQIVQIWLTVPFDGGRHERRIEKIRLLEKQLGLVHSG